MALFVVFFDFSELESVLNAEQQEKQNKLKRYGKRKNENELFKRFKKVGGYYGRNRKVRKRNIRIRQ